MAHSAIIKFSIFVLRNKVYMWRILFLFICGIFYFTPHTTAQAKPLSPADDKPLRIELKVRSDNETYRVIPCGTSGALLFFKSLETADNTRTKWYFSLYDKNLQQVWVKSLPILNELEYKDLSLKHDTLALIFQVPGKDKGQDYNFLVSRVLLAKGNFIINTGKLPENSNIGHFELSGQKAFIALNSKDEPSRMMVADLVTGTASHFSFSGKISSTVTSFFVDTSRNIVFATVKKQMLRNRSEVYLVQFDISGNFQSETLISTITDDRYLLETDFVAVKPDEFLIFGSYGSASGKHESDPTREQGESTGFYYSRVEGGVQKTIEFFNFLELKNAKSLLDEKEIAMLRKKALKKNRELGDFSLDYKLLLHPVIRDKDKFILLAEVFHPQYHSENYTDFDFYGQPFTNSYTVFDGYRFSNAIITAFNKEGNLLWDNNMEIRNLVTFDLSPKVNAYLSGGNVVLTYLSDGKIASKIISGDNVVEKLDFSSFDLSYPDDKLLSETKSRMTWWYGNYFLCYGYEDIKNVALDGNNRRLVYYFSKIRFE
jgi:hypothetical protein